MGLTETLRHAVPPIIAALDPEAAVAGALAGMEVDPSRLLVLALGKGAPAMARGAVAALGPPREGLVVAVAPAEAAPLEVVVGDHPVPGAASFAAGERLLQLAAAAGASDTVVALISGGGSALAEAPAPGVDPREIATATAELLAGGAPIGDLNERRQRWSRLKGGGLARACGDATVVTLVMDDIPGGGPQLVASGPTVDEEALAEGRHRLEPVLGPENAAAAARRELADRGITARIADEPMTGDAARRGAEVGARVLADGVSMVHTGETTVRVTGTGLGGRNQHLALAAAIALDGAADAAVLALATDGVDGPTPAAGAVVDGTTVARLGGMEAAVAALGRCDSHRALGTAGALVVTGVTGTNVADVVMAVTAG